MKFTDNSFSFRFDRVDRQHLDGITPEQYSISTISEKYRDAFRTIVSLFRKIQEYQALTENDSYKVFSSVLLNNFQKEVRELAGNKAAQNIIDAISGSTGTDSLKNLLKEKIAGSVLDDTKSG